LEKEDESCESAQQNAALLWEDAAVASKEEVTANTREEARNRRTAEPSMEFEEGEGEVGWMDADYTER